MNLERLLDSLPILIGTIFIIVGLAMIIFPPKKINDLYGYRTQNSMKNIECWNFAQGYSARLLILLGVIFSIIAIIGLFVNLRKSISLIITMFLMLFFCGIIVFITEKKIKEKFE